MIAESVLAAWLGLHGGQDASPRDWMVFMPEGHDQTFATPAEARAYVDRRPKSALVMTATDDNRGAYAVTTLYARAGADGEITWFATLRFSRFERVTERFADAHICPAIIDAVRTVQGLPVPYVYVSPASSSQEQPDSVVLDDVAYSLEGPAAFERPFVEGRLSMSGGSLTPLAAWSRRTLASLQSCWMTTPPPDS
jgi:hypothetical protein